MGFPNAKEREFLEQLDAADESGPGVTLLRQLEQEDVSCPAGTALGDSCVKCSIEDHVIEGRKEPHSIESFCAGDYKLCPTWQLEKQRIADKKKPASYLAERRQEGVRARAIKEAHRTDRYERAKYLLFSFDDEAIRFRRRLKLPDPDPVRAKRVLAGKISMQAAA